MDFDLSEEQKLVRDTARDFAQREIAPKAGEIDKSVDKPRFDYLFVVSPTSVNLRDMDPTTSTSTTARPAARATGASSPAVASPAQAR